MVLFSYPPISVTLAGVATEVTLQEAVDLLTSIDGKDFATETTLAALDAKVTAVDTGAVVVSSSVLPTGASTEATLSSLNAKVTAVNTGAVTVSSSALPTGASTEATLSSLNAKVTVVDTGAVVVSSSVLPTGASTEATLSSLNAKVTAVDTGAVTISSALPAGSNNIGDVDVLSLPALPAGTNNIGDVDVLTLPSIPAGTNLIGKVQLSGKTKANAPARNDYSSANVTTSAYTTLVASLTSDCSELEIFDSSGQTLVLATGAAASEVDQIYIFPGGNGRVPLSVTAGTRISIKAVSATASVGEIAVNFYA